MTHPTQVHLLQRDTATGPPIIRIHQIQPKSSYRAPNQHINPKRRKSRASEIALLPHNNNNNNNNNMHLESNRTERFRTSDWATESTGHDIKIAQDRSETEIKTPTKRSASRNVGFSEAVVLAKKRNNE
ncbi:hypothetical protein H6P81_005406 [Aristolochia fimbriata]|uniref:Uncharacterized protein n=1 Tax=Aristolochia fimbriata TaxID=158543 RepID=A0AAV7EXX0_ARIFI|nr:hypothetical protein H6P81_005406 [Aristolochia fimbriata]